MMRLMLIDLNSDELYYCEFIISLGKYDGICETAEDQFGKICVLSKIET